MKKAAIIICAALLGVVSPASSLSGYVTYAYLPNSAPLLDSAGEIICNLPASYFTVIEGDETNGKYPVSYLDLSGYILSQNLEITDYEPVTKFAALSARPDNDGMAVNLRDKPDSQNGKVLVSVPADATLTLYGGKEGNELFSGAGSLWQYVRYNAGAITYYGYVYSAQLSCDAVKPNVIEKVERPAADKPIEETPADINVSRIGNIILAVALCVPAVIIMLVLFYRSDSKRTPRHSGKE